MFQTATSILTLIALGCHVLLGCCAHHAHHSHAAADVEHEHVASVVDASSDAQADGHGHSHVCGAESACLPMSERPVHQHVPDESAPHEHDQAPCEVQSCSYVLSDVAKVPDGLAPGPVFDGLAAVEGPSVLARTDLRGRVDADACTAGYRDGARLHELMAVWLL